MVERRAGRDQRAHHLVMAEMGGGDQRRAVIGAGDVGRLAAAFQRRLEHRHVVGNRRNGDDVVALAVERVRIGAERHEFHGRGILLGEGGDVEGRAAVRVAHVHIGAVLDEPLDRRRIAARRRRVKAVIGGEFGRVRRRLRTGGEAEREGKDGEAGRDSGLRHDGLGSPEAPPCAEAGISTRARLSRLTSRRAVRDYSCGSRSVVTRRMGRLLKPESTQVL